MGSSITKHCSVCNSKFTCDSEQGDLSCWCGAFPPIMSLDFDQDCRCYPCLSQAIVGRIKALIQSSGTEEMVEIARPYFNPSNLIEHIDYTIEHRNYVFSSWYHLKRGTCCGNGCRHCPYEI